MNYLHGDHLGSAAVSSRTGTLIERLAYDPWGKRRDINGTADPTDAIQASTGNRGFTLHEHLEEVALVHMNGRIYDPYAARFQTADPYVAQPGNLQNFNCYSYVLSRPLSLIDPTGYEPILGEIRVTPWEEPTIWGGTGCGALGGLCWWDRWYYGGSPISPVLPPVAPAPPVIAPTPIGMVIMPSLAAPLSQPSTAELARQIDKAAKDVANSNLIQTMSDTIVKAAQEAMTRVMPFVGLAQMALQTWMSSNDSNTPQSPSDVLIPNGQPVGHVEGSATPDVRTVSPDQLDGIIDGLMDLGAKPGARGSYPGDWYDLPNRQGGFGIRESKNSGRTVDVNIPGLPDVTKIHQKP